MSRLVAGPLVVLATVVATACGASSRDREARPALTSTTSSMSSTSTTSTTSTPPSGPAAGTERECGPLTAEDVADTAGVAVTDVRRLTESTGDSTCSFAAGQWTFESWEGIPAALEPSVTTIPAPGIPGVAVPGGYRVDMERGGRYVGSVGLFPPGRAIEIRVRNDAAGSDTYPPADGPAQRERTEAATLAVAQRVAAGL